MQVDIVLWQSLELLENAELPPHNLDEASFNELLLHMSLNRVSKSGWENRFVVQNFCGRVVELVPGGKSLPISWSNRKEFVGKALQFLQHEVPGFNPHCVCSAPVPVEFACALGWACPAVGSAECVWGVCRLTFKCKRFAKGLVASSLCQCWS